MSADLRSWEVLLMGVREIVQSLERWQRYPFIIQPITELNQTVLLTACLEISYPEPYG